MDRFFTDSRDIMAQAGIKYPLEGLTKATASNDDNLITLEFGTDKMFLNTKQNKAVEALDRLLSDIQHISSPSVYDVSKAPYYNDITGSKLFVEGTASGQTRGTLIDTSSDVTTQFSNNAFIFTHDLILDTNGEIVTLQVLDPVSATVTYSSDDSTVEVLGASLAASIDVNKKLSAIISFAAAVGDLATEPDTDDTITIPEFIVVDPKTGESITFPAYEHTYA